MDKETLSKHIEALLFAHGDPVPYTTLQKITGVSKTDLAFALDRLKKQLTERGLRVIVGENSATLTTAPELSDLISALKNEEFSRTIGNAGLETLSIILYKAPVSKQDVDYIRGVDSGAVLRNLMVRGLVDRHENPENKRSYMYTSTIDTLRFLGISSANELPQYTEIRNQITNQKHTQPE